MARHASPWPRSGRRNRPARGEACRSRSRPAARSAAISPTRSASARLASRILMKPGPASSTEFERDRRRSRSTTAAPISRGSRRAALAAARAPLHWKSARSGRSLAVTRPNSAGRSAAAKAAPTTSLKARLRSVIGRGVALGLGGDHGRGLEALAVAIEGDHFRGDVETDQHFEIGAADLRAGAGNGDPLQGVGVQHPVLTGRKADRQIEVGPCRSRPGSDR